MTDFPRILVLCLIAAWSMGAESAPEPKPTSAERMIDDLRAADAARAALAREWQDWQGESERMYALLDGVQAQADRLFADAAEAREDAAKIAQEIDEAGTTRRRLAELSQTFATQAAAIRVALVRTAARVVPGTIPASRDIPDDAPAAFAAAVRALDLAERAAASSSIELVEGRIDGATRAVTMLRIAGAGWWSEIDGPRAGIVVPAEAGQSLPQLMVVADSAAVTAIRRAIGVLKGGRAPEVVRLPLPAASVEAAK